MKCTICEKEFQPDDPNVEMPFCSARCKLIDQGRWLDEGYGMPYVSELQLDEEPDLDD